MICERLSNYRAKKYDFDFDEWMRSLEEHPCDDNNHIKEAIENRDKAETLFALEHLIHLRCDYDYCRSLTEFIKKVEWIK